MAKPQDPNKYLKNKDINAESKFSVLVSVIRFGLVIAGIAGIAVEFFKDGGLITKTLGWLFDTTEHMMMIPVIVFVLWLLNHLISGRGKGEIKRSGDIPMYIMMAIGAYYLFKLITENAL